MKSEYITKSIKACLFILFIYVIPLLGNVTLLFDWRIWLLSVAGIFLLLSQPDFSIDDAKDKKSSDSYSVLFILLAGVLSQISIILDFGYLKGGNTGEYDKLHSILGFIMIWGGLVFRYWSIKILDNAFTSSVQIVKEHRLIIRGPYKVIRHPSYLGALLYFYGCAVFVESWIGALVITIVFGFAYTKRIQAEECVLEKEFEEYGEYKKNVPALLPFLIKGNMMLKVYSLLLVFGFVLVGCMIINTGFCSYLFELKEFNAFHILK